MRRLLVLAALLAAFVGIVTIPAGAAPAPVPTEPRPHCEHAVIQENSGNGPDYRVVICDALRRSYGEGWFLIVDGGPLQNGAVIFGSVRP